MTAAEITNGLTQNEYERLLNGLAGAIQTQRRFIEIISAERASNGCMRYKVKRQGSYYLYLIEEMKYCFYNLGLII